MKGFNNVVESDVLVIGGGLAGCQAAIEASRVLAEKGKVVIVDKGRIGKSGQSVFAAGIFTVFDPEEDDFRSWMKELIVAGEYLNDQEWCKKLLEETMLVVKDIGEWAEKLGEVVFEKDGAGQFLRRRSRGHVNTRHNVVNSLPLMRVHRKKMLAQKVQIIDKVMITDLLCHQGIPAAAVGFDFVDSKTYLFRAKTIVLAASGSGFKSVFMGHKNLTGDLQAAAFQAGVVVRNMENYVSNTCARDFDIHGMNLNVGVGGRFINGKDEEFMWKYHPSLGNRAGLPNLVLAFCREVKEGRGPIYLDMRNATPSDRELCRKILPESFKLWDRAGIDPFNQPIEWVPAFLGTLTCGGGLHVNLRCETSLPGLYAAGDISCQPPKGTYSVGGINLAFCAVSGREAGKNAAAAALTSDQKDPSGTTIAKLAGEAVRATLAPVTRPSPGKVSVREALNLVQRAIIPADVAYLKTAGGLSRILAEINRIEQEVIPQLSASTPHELRNAIEIRSMTTVAKLMTVASLAREESRGFHFREEFPKTNNKDWLKWVMLQKDGQGEIQISTRDVPTPYLQPVEEYTAPPGTRRD